jgi:hypothetical protein
VPSLDADIAALAAALSASADADADLNPSEVAALLRQHERADGVAQGVKARLDGILSGLDGLLGSLGADSGEDLVGTVVGKIPWGFVGAGSQWRRYRSPS